MRALRHFSQHVRAHWLPIGWCWLAVALGSLLVIGTPASLAGATIPWHAACRGKLCKLWRQIVYHEYGQVRAYTIEFTSGENKGYFIHCDHPELRSMEARWHDILLLLDGPRLMSSTLDGGEPNEKKMYMDARGSRIEVPLNVMVDLIESSEIKIIHSGKEYSFDLANIHRPMSIALQEMISRRSGLRSIEANQTLELIRW